MRSQRYVALALGAAILLSGCTRVVVKKDPGPDDEGFRYYRPKPYLMVAPAPPTEETGAYVSITVEYLPDFNEEYSIHWKPGMGQGKLNFTLENGWNLTSVGVETDQQIDELIGSVAQLAGAFPITAKAGSTLGTTNVPIGLYEAVIATDPMTCRRRLFGWRYVGFAPYTGCDVCPIDGMHPVSCTELYGLMMNTEGHLTFGPLPCAAPNDGYTSVAVPAPAESEEQ